MIILFIAINKITDFWLVNESNDPQLSTEEVKTKQSLSNLET